MIAGSTAVVSTTSRPVIRRERPLERLDPAPPAAAPPSSPRPARPSGSRAAALGSPRAGPAAARGGRARRAARAACARSGRGARVRPRSPASAAFRAAGIAGFTSARDSTSFPCDEVRSNASRSRPTCSGSPSFAAHVEQGAGVAGGGGAVVTCPLLPGAGRPVSVAARAHLREVALDQARLVGRRSSPA